MNATSNRISKRRNRDILITRVLLVLGGLFLLIAVASVVQAGVWPSRAGAALAEPNFIGIPLATLGIGRATFLMGLFVLRIFSLALTIWFIAKSLVHVIRLGGLGRKSGRLFGYAGYCFLGYAIVLALEHNEARVMVATLGLPTEAAGPWHLDMSGVVLYLFITVLFVISLAGRRAPTIQPRVF